jgi:Ca-activated chloride channel family protein
VLEELMPEVSTGRTALKFILFCTAAVLLILAVARPQFGSKLREEKAQGVEMMLVVDVSNSMLAEDFEPNRLERTKYAINKLFDGLRQDRVGLIVFAGEPKVQLPITSDYRMAKAFAKRIDPSLVSVQGTAIGKALSQALLSFSGETEETHSRVIILVTDGENHEDDALAVAKRAAEMGIRIYTIGIGTPEGAPIQIGGEFIKDEKGDMVVSKLDEKMLSEVAQITGGAYVRSTKQSIGLDEIVKSINEMEQTELSMMRFEEFNEQYQYLLIAALVLLLAEFLLLDRRNPLLAHLNIFREK